MSILINEIFRSIEGETTAAGFPAIFIRTCGCNLNCRYCDTRSAMSNGKPMEVEQIIKMADELMPARHITITGGEPLAQKEIYPLLDLLVEKKYITRLETNGSFNLSAVHYSVEKIVDVKTPSSGEAGSFCMENIPLIKKGDEIKFVVSDENDFRFAVDFIGLYLKDTEAIINMSPVTGQLEPGRLADMILNEKIIARLNIQLHKLAGFR